MVCFKVTFQPCKPDLMQYFKGAVNRWVAANGGIVSEDYQYIICEGGEDDRPAKLLRGIVNGSSCVFKWDAFPLSVKYAYEHARGIYAAHTLNARKRTA